MIRPALLPLLLSLAAVAPSDGRRRLRAVFDPRTVTHKPTPEQEARLEELKTVEPAVFRTRPLAPGEVGVDVVSVGSETRFGLMTSQLETWAAPSRAFYGFSEAQDYDPDCPARMSDDAVRAEYMNVCRTTGGGTKAYGVGHGSSGGWFCAQRRVTRALGWLQYVYGYRGTPGDGPDVGATGTTSLPDVLIIVDDDTSVDVDRVVRIVEEGGEGGARPYVAAGSVFQLGKFGGFHAAHGGFGTFFNRAALELLTTPIRCDGVDDGGRSAAEASFSDNACEKLRENRAREFDAYRPGDSVLDVFYKLSARPYFCMHSDWAMGYMITNYLDTGLHKVEPSGSRTCSPENVSCHYQGPESMALFVATHPQGGGGGVNTLDSTRS